MELNLGAELLAACVALEIFDVEVNLVEVLDERFGGEFFAANPARRLILGDRHTGMFKFLMVLQLPVSREDFVALSAPPIALEMLHRVNVEVGLRRKVFLADVAVEFAVAQLVLLQVLLAGGDVRTNAALQFVCCFYFKFFLS